MLSEINKRFFKEAVGLGRLGNETASDIAARCPICGDSKHNKRVKRLHLYEKGGLELVNCFNAGCPCENKTMYKFLKEFFPRLLPNYKKEIFFQNMNSLKSLSGKKSSKINQENQTFDFENTTIAKKEAISDVSETSDKFDFENTTIAKKETGEILYSTNSTNKNLKEPLYIELEPFFEDLTDEYKSYLTKRGLPFYFNNKWFKAKTDIEISDILYKIKDFLVIPLYNNGKIYGFYSRDIKEKKFITYITTPGFKVWNFFDVNKDEPVYIFEAIFDAISSGLTNIVANLGAKIPEERLKELKQPVFCLDNDRTGILTSIEYAKRGYKIFIQPDKFKEKDINELKLNHPELDISKLIKENSFAGISALTRLKIKLKG